MSSRKGVFFMTKHPKNHENTSPFPPPARAHLTVDPAPRSHPKKTRTLAGVWQDFKKVKESTTTNSPSPLEPSPRDQEEELHWNYINWLQEELS